MWISDFKPIISKKKNHSLLLKKKRLTKTMLREKDASVLK